MCFSILCRAESNWRNYAIKYSSVKIWYKTPNYVQQSVKSINSYKNSLHAYLLNKQINYIVNSVDDDDDYECLASAIDAVIERILH